MIQLICKACGAHYDSSTLSCPYCGQVNEKALAKAVKLETYDKSFQSERNKLLEEGQILVLRNITIGICLIFSIIAVLFCGLTYYYEYHDTLKRKVEMSFGNYERNLTLIQSYIDNGDYLRALTLAKATDMNDDVLGYADVSEELNMISYYYLFTGYIQSYIVGQQHIGVHSFHEDLEDIYLGHFLLDSPYKVYTTPASSERALNVKKELTSCIDLYLKSFYRLTDEEVTLLKSAASIDDFKLEGKKDYSTIIAERMKAYEKAHES